MNSNDAMTDSPDKSGGPWTWIIAALLAAVIVGVIVVTQTPVPPQPNEKPDGAPHDPPAATKLTAEQVQKLLALKNLAIGHLENEDYAPADEALQQIIALAPEEDFGHRNLAVCRLLEFTSSKSEQAAGGGRAIGRESVDAAIAGLRENNPDSAFAHWTEAKAILKTREGATDFDEQDQLLADAMQALSQAAAADPNNAAFWYEQYEIAQLTASDELRAQASAALQKAFDLAPDNVRVLTSLLAEQVRAKDFALLDTLPSAKKTLVPISQTATDLEKAPQMIDAALRAVTAARDVSDEQERARHWTDATRNIIQLGHIFRPQEITKSDLKRVAPHPLEFTVYDFSPAFYDKYGPFESAAPPAIDVSFTAASDTGPLADLAGVVDILLVDVDLDGRLDIVALRDSELVVVSRPDNEQTWTERLRTNIPSGAKGIIAADLDRDAKKIAASNSSAERPIDSSASQETPSAGCHEADVDFVVFGDFGAVVLRNDLSNAANGDNQLAPIEQSAAFAAMQDVAGAAFIDLDHDGDLDLVLSAEGGIHIWASSGDMTFQDISSISQLPPAERKFTSLVVVDWDRDVDLDVLLAGDDGPLGYLENLRHAQFRWRPLADASGEPVSAQTLALLEADGRASWDLAAAGDHGLNVLLTATSEPGNIQVVQNIDVANDSFRGVAACDYDNDGVRDLLAWSNDKLALFRGAPDGRFAIVDGVLPVMSQVIVAVDVADIDNDGDEDIARAGASGVRLLINEGGNQNSWLAVKVVGLDDNVTGRVNHSGLNSLLELKSGARYQAQVVSRPTTHFGLGQQDRADILRVLMTNGIPQAEIHPAPNQVICEPQILKGSCPFLYTWNGERYEFYTDLCWAGPLGLQLAPGVLAPSRPWEYLLIEGDRLAPKDGRYHLQVTEELWEAAYFDQIELIAVDHPADVEVYSNEKVGPAEIAEFKVHTVRERRYPVSAVDSNGRNALAKISARDGDYLQAFERRILQGLTEEHYVELDLGDLRGTKEIKLFLTGWICPTDTSLNVGIAQNPDLELPRPPHVLAIDESGQWREAIAYMGFPGGKTKTIAVDLSGAFTTGDYRLRIATSAEIYWDEIFLTVDEAPAEVRLHPLSIHTADLHYRGFSELLPRDSRSPHRYDYDRVETNQVWPPMSGAYTRYGDVRELLTSTDDRLVVMASGDEITLTIDPPAADLPPGWKRDFLIHNVGWDKDADLNTVYGQQVEPLPFNAMQSYPYAEGENYPDTPQTRAYLREYQTRRTLPADFWRRIPRHGSATE